MAPGAQRNMGGPGLSSERTWAMCGVEKRPRRSGFSRTQEGNPSAWVGTGGVRGVQDGAAANPRADLKVGHYNGWSESAQGKCGFLNQRGRNTRWARRDKRRIARKMAIRVFRTIFFR